MLSLFISDHSLFYTYMYVYDLSMGVYVYFIYIVFIIVCLSYCVVTVCPPHRDMSCSPAQSAIPGTE